VNRKTIQIVETHKKGDYSKFYSFVFLENGNQISEFRHFASKIREGEFHQEYLDILTAIEILVDKELLKDYFRPCSKMSDNVMALPGKDDENMETKSDRLNNGDLRVLRLYCCIPTKSIAIIGNGGIKATRDYNSDTTLNEYVNILIAIDKKLMEFGISDSKSKEENEEILNNNLKFEIEWE
jgi:hypothetical protein